MFVQIIRTYRISWVSLLLSLAKIFFHFNLGGYEWVEHIVDILIYHRVRCLCFLYIHSLRLIIMYLEGSSTFLPPLSIVWIIFFKKSDLFIFIHSLLYLWIWVAFFFYCNMPKITESSENTTANLRSDLFVGFRICHVHSWRVRTLIQKWGFLGMILNCIWWWDSSSGDLKSVWSIPRLPLLSDPF